MILSARAIQSIVQDVLESICVPSTIKFNQILLQRVLEKRICRVMGTHGLQLKKINNFNVVSNPDQSYTITGNAVFNTTSMDFTYTTSSCTGHNVNHIDVDGDMEED